MPALLGRLVSWISAFALALAPVTASANPLNGQVVGGAASIAGQGTPKVVVNQSTNRAIVNWGSFNIAPSETTQFVQPNASSVILNRVTGSLGASQINGVIRANGGVYVVNPDGILFGPSANINVGSFLATTHDIANSDFMAGSGKFTISGNPTASIVNQGTITAANGGFAALVAPGVRNDGIITANLGRVALASGNAFTLDLYGDNLITLQANDAIAANVVDVATGQTLKSLVQNTGKLKANGGTVSLTAVAAKQVVESVINSSGVIEANSVGMKNGLVVFGAATEATKPAGAPPQTVVVSGRISAAGRKAKTTGGKIQITGENIELAGATLDASGKAGGGTVLIGGVGNSQAGPAIPIASHVSVDVATTIDVSARDTGNGGTVVVWSDQLTTVAGSIAARGGAESGDGGFVETSGSTVDFSRIRVDTSAPAGKTGTWLLDPTDLTVDSTAAATIEGNLVTTNVTLQTNADGTTNGPGVTSSGPGDIIVAAPISWASSNTLTLDAYNAITVNAPITVTGAGGLALTAAMNPLAPAAPLISFGAGASVQFTGAPNSGQSLAIDGQAYTLLYSVSDVQNINATSASLAGYYALAKPLNATGVSSWTPIGTNGAGNVLDSGNGFAGTFEGLGNTISNLTVNLPASNNVGLFGFVGAGGLIQNFGVIGGSVTGEAAVGALVGVNLGVVAQSYGTDAVTGSSWGVGLVGINQGAIWQSYAAGAVSSSSLYVGGLVGINDGAISQSYASGKVSGSQYVGGLVGVNNRSGGSFGIGSHSYATGDGTVTQSYATGAVTGGMGTSSGAAAIAGVGGLVGINGNSITQSYATGAVIGEYAGGLVGANVNANVGVISQSYATGAVSGVGGAFIIGGLVGYNTGGISQSYATGLVSTTGSNAGGLVGHNSGNVSASYWDTTTTGQASGVGTSTGTFSATGLTTSQFATASNFPALSFGTSPNASGCAAGSAACWVIVDVDSSLNNAGGAVGATRPMLLSEYSTTIANAHQLQLMELDLTASYTLANNIDLGPSLANPSDVWGPNGSAGFVPIGNPGAFTGVFTGAFNGAGNTIANLTINQPSSNYVGLFGKIGSGGLIENVGLLGGSVSGNSYVGDLVGFNLGTVTNAYSTGAVNVNISTNANTLVDVYAGGLVGYSGGSIANSHSTGAVNVSIEGTNTSIDAYAGGLVGYDYASIANSYATGAVSVTLAGTNTTEYSYSDTAYAGGLAGYNSGASITNSSATGAVSVTLAGTNTNTSSYYYYGDDTAYAGGLVGYNNGSSIANSSATGAVSVTLAVTNTNTSDYYYFYGDTAYAGGLVGYNYGSSIANSSATGAISIGSTNTNTFVDAYAGGLVGSNGCCASGASITSSYATGTVSVTLADTNTNTSDYYYSDTAYAGGLVGYSSDGSIANSYATGAVSLILADTDANTSDYYYSDSAYAGGLVGYNSGSSIANSSASGVVNVSIGGANTNAFADVYAGGLVGSNGASITNSSATGAVSVTLVRTNTNSNYYYYSDTAYAGGLVGYNYGSSIANSSATGAVSIADATTSASGYSYGDSAYAGGLVGYNDGSSIANSHAIGAVSIGSTNTNTFVNAYAGGLVGSNVCCASGASITYSDATGTVSVTLADTNTSGYFYSDTAYAGGLVGSNDGSSIANSYATGVVNVSNGATSTNAFADVYAGGLVGSNGASITNSSATGAVSVTLAGANTNTSDYYYSDTVTAGGLVGTNYGSSIANSSASGVVNVSIGGTNTNAFADVYAGGLVGSNDASITNSSATGAVSVTLAGANTNTSDYYYNNTTYAGGLVGYNNGSSIAYSSATGAVSIADTNTNTTGYSYGDSAYAGGLVGYNDGSSIANSHATGAVSIGSTVTNTFVDAYAGGLVGSNGCCASASGASITNSYATGAVSITDTNANTSSYSYSDTAYAGGLVGYNFNCCGVNGDPIPGVSITNSYATGAVSVTLADTNANTNASDCCYGGSAYAGGLVGYNYGSSIASSSASGVVNVSFGGTNTNAFADVYAGGLVGSNGCCASGASITNSSATGAVSVTLAGTNTNTSSYYYGDIAYAGGLVGYNYGNSIANSSATGAVSIVDTNTNTSGYSFGDTAYAGGLVGYNYGSSIANSSALGAVSVTLAGTNTNGYSYGDTAYAGGLVGYNYGSSIANSSATGAVSIANTTTSASGYSYGAYAGGLVGFNSNCCDVNGDPLTISQSHATGAVTVGANGTAGGLVGFNSANCCDASANSIGGAITNSYATGAVTAGDYGTAGGLVGSNAGAIARSYATGAVTVGSYASAGGLVGSNGNYDYGYPSAGASIANSYATGFVVSAGVNVDIGGLVGFNSPQSLIQNSDATGNVTATGTLPNQNNCSTNCDYINVGGLAGGNNGAVSGSYATGAVTAVGSIPVTVTAYMNVGGLLGYNAGTVSGSYATGVVTGGSYANVGGLAGANGNYDANGNPIAGASIANSYAAGVVTSAGMNVNIGGLVGFNSSFSAITNSFATGNASATGTPPNQCSFNCPNINVGGLVGGNNGSVSGSYATGAVTAVGSNVGRGGSYTDAGGLVGYNGGAVSGSYATGAVTIGTNASAGGLVGENGSYDSNGNPIAGATITNSYATGAVSSLGFDLNIGGLVGENDPLSLITNSRATGNVSATGTIASQDCSGGGVCDYLIAGGLVGISYGTISGPSWVTPPTACGAGDTCYSGTVTVGSEGDGGGLVGFNLGVITNAFAIANVSGAPGLSIPIGSAGYDLTRLGGLAAKNLGQITNSFALGAVGSLTTANLEVGGLVSQNFGLISGSFANAAVSAGDNSIAGGLVGSNLLADSSTCFGCYTGYSENLTETISNSNAYGNVAVGASSIAGGLVGETDFFGDSIPGAGSISNSNAFGAVTAGGNSIVGGLAGAAASAISYSSAQNTLVSSTGANSIVGGLVGLNAGSVTNSSTTAPVSGVSDSFIGGLVGINLGLVSQSSVDPTITGSGGGNLIGGIAGLNIGTITGGAAQVTLVSGDPSNYVGGIAGINGTYANGTATIADSSFPTGTIVATTATGNGFSGPLGSTTLGSPPSPPSWLNNCTGLVCSILASGTSQPATPTPPSTPPSTPTAIPTATPSAVPTPTPAPTPTTLTLTIPTQVVTEVVTNGANPSVANNPVTQPNNTGCKSGAIEGFGFTQLAASPTWRSIAREVANSALLRKSVAAADLGEVRRRVKVEIPGAEDATALAQRIGNTVIVRNQVEQLSGAAADRISVGDNVFLDETVRTGEDSNGKFVLSDETNLALGPRSTVKLDRFVFSGSGEGTYSKAVLNLTKGTFRFITGKSPKTAYEIDTPTASIGVRGTIVDIKIDKGKTTVALQEGNASVCLRGNSSHCTAMKPGQTVAVTLTRTALTPSGWSFASACTGNSALCGQTTVAQAGSVQRVALGSASGQAPCAP